MRAYTANKKIGVLKQIIMLMRWFETNTDTSIGDADYSFLVKKLIENEADIYSNSDLFFTNLHGKKYYKKFFIKHEEQELFNQRIHNFMVLNNLSWEYYKGYIK